MAQRTGKGRRKTRSKLSKNIRQKGKISIRKYLQEFRQGDKVAFVAEPAVQKGIYDRKMHGRIGNVLRKRGKCYEIKINAHGRFKTMIVHPVHLKKIA